ncbi:hypothetical protein PSPO01_03903 [Paraphaeosphaeria sporulosa]
MGSPGGEEVPRWLGGPGSAKRRRPGQQAARAQREARSRLVPSPGVPWWTDSGHDTAQDVPSLARCTLARCTLARCGRRAPVCWRAPASAARARSGSLALALQARRRAAAAVQEQAGASVDLLQGQNVRTGLAASSLGSAQQGVRRSTERPQPGIAAKRSGQGARAVGSAAMGTTRSPGSSEQGLASSNARRRAVSWPKRKLHIFPSTHHHRVPFPTCTSLTRTAPDLPCPAPQQKPRIFSDCVPIPLGLQTEADPCPESRRTDAAVDSAIPRPPCYPPGHPRPRCGCSPSLLLTRCAIRLATIAPHISPCPPRPRYLDTHCSVDIGSLHRQQWYRRCASASTSAPRNHCASTCTSLLHPQPRSFLTKHRYCDLWGKKPPSSLPIRSPAPVPPRIPPSNPTASPCYTACISPLPSTQEILTDP